MQANYVQRLRLIFRKEGATRYIGHLDLARALERALNRARIPLAYSQGYNKRPRMQLAAPLPLGFTSACELADIWLLEQLAPEAAHKQMMARMAPGIVIEHLFEVDLSGPALPSVTESAEYTVTLRDPIERAVLQERIDAFLSAAEAPAERRGKRYDLRPLVLALAVGETADQQLQLQMHLQLLPSLTGRPDEVAIALGLDPLACHIHRTAITLSAEPSIPQQA